MEVSEATEHAAGTPSAETVENASVSVTGDASVAEKSEESLQAAAAGK